MTNFSLNILPFEHPIKEKNFISCQITFRVVLSFTSQNCLKKQKIYFQSKQKKAHISIPISVATQQGKTTYH